MALILTDEQKVTLTLQATTSKGKVVGVQGAPAWTVSNPAVLSLVVAPDGLSAIAVALTLGTATVSAVADANLGAPVSQINASLEIQVTPAIATILTMTGGVPALQ